jgi:xanthine dehydrogenase YagS FAD-binding subunit
MHAFTISKVADQRSAVASHSRATDAAFIAGGTDLVGLMKDGLARPSRLLDINAMSGMDHVKPTPDGGLEIGALARMSDVAANVEVRRRFPVIAEGLLFAASGQLRNMASLGGNIMQRTRCAYFRDADAPACNKRQPGSGCSARDGINRLHAVFGWSDSCVATHPSDVAVAFAAMDAMVHIRGVRGERSIKFSDFHRLPGDAPDKDNVLDRDDLIVSIEVPGNTAGRASHYLKLRDRQSYEFALVSVAAGLEVRDGVILKARIALGGVAHKPWRLPSAEDVLAGAELSDTARLRSAVAVSFREARPLKHNAFKIELAQRAVVRAIQTAGARA